MHWLPNILKFNFNLKRHKLCPTLPPLPSLQQRSGLCASPLRCVCKCLSVICWYQMLFLILPCVSISKTVWTMSEVVLNVFSLPNERGLDFSHLSFSVRRNCLLSEISFHPDVFPLFMICLWPCGTSFRVAHTAYPCMNLGFSCCFLP